MTKGITNRITMQELINALNTLTFEEVTKESLQKALPVADIDFVNEVDDSIKDLSIDDYIFSIYKSNYRYPSNYILVGNPSEKPFALSNYVEVYLPTQEDDKGDYGSEVKAKGYIEKHNADQDFWLRIEFHVN